MTALKDKVAIVTGASSGIGRAAAKLFATEGAVLVVTARRQAELDQLVDEITAGGGTAIAVAGDIREEALAQQLVETATERFGGLDIGFNNAGIVGELGPIGQMASGSWRELIETNLTSAFLGAKYERRRWRRAAAAR